jgi:hypothetical protein
MSQNTSKIETVNISHAKKKKERKKERIHILKAQELNGFLSASTSKLWLVKP